MHICILRTLLDAADLTEQQAICAFSKLARILRVVHGDPHVGNAKKRLGGGEFEVVDFERSFMLGSNDEESIISSTEQYAKHANARARLLQTMRKQGLDDTRQRFIAICSAQFNLLSLELEDFLNFFDLS